MSLQYINPYYMPYNQAYPIQQRQVQVNRNQYIESPYQTSFYMQNNLYPYNNPNFAPNLSNLFAQLKLQQANLGYIKTGETIAPNGDFVHFYKLNNGHEVAIVQRENAETIVKTFVDAGSMNETDEKRGVSHVNEHGLFKGSSKLKDGDVFKYTGEMGAYTNASTDYAQINYYISAPYMGEEELKKTIEIQGDMIYNPTFDYEAMESEKGPICSEISMINDDPTTKAFDKTIRNLFQIDSTSENLVAGSIATVKALTTEDMHNYHQTYYAPENLHTVIVADKNISLDNIMQYAKDNFRAVNKHNKKIPVRKEVLSPIKVSKREDIISSKTNSTTSFIAFSGPRPKDTKELVIADMLNYYLEHSSTSDLKNYLESINGYYTTAQQKVGLREDDPLAFINMIQTNPNDEQKGIDAFYDAIIKLQTQPLSDEDLKAIKTQLKKLNTFTMIDSENLCDRLGNSMRDNALSNFTDVDFLLNSITKEDIMNFARKYYNLNRASIVVVHPSSVTQEQIRENYSTSKYSQHNISKQKNTNPVSFTGIKNIDTKDVREYKLVNNTNLILNDTPSNACVFNWNVETTPIKPKNPNIPAVLMYMFKKGSEYKNQNELERYKELNGIYLDTYVGKKGIEINGNCLSENMEETLNLINELMYHPKLTQKDFEIAKQSVKSTLIASQKDATENLLDSLYPGYFPTVEKMLKTIDELRLEDVKAFYNDLLKNASSSFVATAPIKKHPKLESMIIAHQNMPNIIFKEFTPELTQIFEANPENNVVYDTDDLNQAQICKTYKFELSGNIKDEATFELVNTILGGSSNARLFADLREKQNLAYSVSSHIQSFENTGILTLQIQTTTDNKEANIQSFDNVEKSLEGFNKHTDLLCNELVTDEELASAKMQLKQKIVGQCQNPLTENDLLAMNATEPYGIKRIDEYVKAIDKITKEDIQKAAQFIFSNNPTISILASEDTINSQLDYLSTQGKLEKASA